MPYRSAPIEHEKRTAEPGIVADMVRQFADKHAFLRELVQNGIDAGASRIEVQIDRDDAGVCRTSVSDDGAGMTRAVIEGPLLTLFSSSKENDSAKIGKYGIGFVSVFALEPDVVEVRTFTANEGWLLRLFGDHTWELAPATNPEPAATGTTVTLVQPMTVEAFTAHVTAATSALSKWCRHARIPIELIVLDAGDPTATRRVPIVEPFAAAGLVSVIWAEGNERIVAAVGEPPKQPASFLGFYNRGLTLHESEKGDARGSALARVRVKIDAPALAHTLSRDGVVQDREYRRLVEHAVDLVQQRLWPELLGRIAAAATSATAPQDFLPYLDAVQSPAFASLRAKNQYVLPLVEPFEGQNTMTVRKLVDRSHGALLFAPDSSPLTRLLAKDGRPVVRWTDCMSYLSGLADVTLAHVEEAYAYAGPGVEPHDGDAALEEATKRLLAAIGRKVKYVQLARFAGAARAMPYRVTEARDSHVSAANAHVQRWGSGATMQLNVEDAAVRLARRRARSQPGVASHLLVRALLVAEGPLSAKLVDQLLEAALE